MDAYDPAPDMPASVVELARGGKRMAATQEYSKLTGATPAQAQIAVSRI